MYIENGQLTVEVGGESRVFALPAVPVHVKVKAWAVPTNYREEGVFIAVKLPGEPEEIPACDLSACRYLGEAELEPDEAAQIAHIREAKRAEIKAACDAAAAVLAQTYPNCEVQSWPQQVMEATALATDKKASAPLLSAIAKARGIELADLAGRVRAKAAAYGEASGELIGRRQAADDQLNTAVTCTQLFAVTLRLQD